MATKGKKSSNLPAVPSGVDKQTRDFLIALKEIVETMQGKRRNSFMDSVVTFQDLQSMGFKVSSKVGTDADYDFTRFIRNDNPPNPPRDLVVQQQVFANKLTWTNPSDEDLSHIEVWCSVGAQSLSESVRIGIVTAPVLEFMHAGLNTRTSHYYWIRSVNWAGIYSVWEPRQGGYLVPASLDLAREEALHVLNDSITESELYDSLSSRIDLIDGDDSLAGSVNERLKIEAIARGEAITLANDRIDAESVARGEAITLANDRIDAESVARETAVSLANDRIDAESVARGVAITLANERINAEAIDRGAAITSEKTERVNADGALSQDITNLSSRVDDNVSAIQIESTTRADADTAQAAQITTLFSESADNQAAIVVESEARTTADSALTTSLNALGVEVNDNTAAIQTEQTARVDGDTALSQQLTTLGVRVDDNVSAIQTESTTRADADTAQAAQITTLFSESADNQAAIVVESEARTTADSALTTSLNALGVEVNDNTAAIQTEQTARVDGDTALSQQLTTLGVRVDDNVSAIQTESITRADNDLVLSERIVNLSARIFNNVAAVQNESSVRAEYDSAFASQITTLFSESADNQAAIVAESTARTTNVSALSSSLNALGVEVNNNTAAIQTEQTARVDADSALSDRIIDLSARVYNNVAAVQNESIVRAETDVALASQIQTVQASADDNTAAIQVEATARADADGALAAEYFIKTDVNGYVSGFGVHNSGATSEAVFLVDRFAVVTPGAAAKTPFVIGNVDGVSTVGIDGNMIIDGGISTRTLDSEIMTGAFLSASAQISLGLNGLLTMAEGAKLFAGAGNFLLDTSGNQTSLIVGQDGAVDVEGNIAAGSDYMLLSGGDIQFYRWLADDHRMYKALKRWETGYADNGAWVELPGYWVAPPQIQLSPRNLTCYKSSSPTDQALNMAVTDIEEFSANRYRFMADARLIIAAGSQDNPVGYSAAGADSAGPTSSYSTPANCTRVTAAFLVSSVAVGPISASYYYRTVTVSILVDGAVKASTNVSIGASLGSQSGVISSGAIPAGSHTVCLKAVSTSSSTTFSSGTPTYESTSQSGSQNYSLSTTANAFADSSSGTPDRDQDESALSFSMPWPTPGAGWEFVSATGTVSYSVNVNTNTGGAAEGRVKVFGTTVSSLNRDGAKTQTFNLSGPPGTCIIGMIAYAEVFINEYNYRQSGSAWGEITLNSVQVTTNWRRLEGSTGGNSTNITFQSVTMDTGAVNELAAGTVNYIAIGE